jgi:hypothetical protein
MVLIPDLQSVRRRIGEVMGTLSKAVQGMAEKRNVIYDPLYVHNQLCGVVGNGFVPAVTRQRAPTGTPMSGPIRIDFLIARKRPWRPYDAISVNVRRLRDKDKGRFVRIDAARDLHLCMEYDEIRIFQFHPLRWRLAAIMGTLLKTVLAAADRRKGIGGFPQAGAVGPGSGHRIMRFHASEGNVNGGPISIDLLNAFRITRSRVPSDNANGGPLSIDLLNAFNSPWSRRTAIGAKVRHLYKELELRSTRNLICTNRKALELGSGMRPLRR